MRYAGRVRWLAVVFLAAACGNSRVDSPFIGEADGGADAEAGADAGPDALADAAADADPTLGGPCLDDGQCDDGVECTSDSCDGALRRCRNVPDDTRCADSNYCDGVERCVPGLGCREGEPVSCSDNDTCTIDTCEEADRTCSHVLRDVDGDGDPDWNCGGGDCNDTNPDVSSLTTEVCVNGVDDDCDQEVDETACAVPLHDVCADAREVVGSETFSMSTGAAALDYAATCAGETPPFRDVVAALIVPGGPAQDIAIQATATRTLAIAAAGQCGDASSELGCASAPLTSGPVEASLLLRSVSPGAVPLYVFTEGEALVDLTIDYRPATAPPENETCGSALTVSPGVHEQVEIFDAALDYDSACGKTLGELVYRFELTEPRDVRVYATSVDGKGDPNIALLPESCAEPEIGCARTSPALVFKRNVAPGIYHVAVSASSPTLIDFVVETAPPSTPAADETCDTAPPVQAGQTLSIDLFDHTDDIATTCDPAAVDAAYQVNVSEQSDVLVLQRISSGDTGTAALFDPACETELVCHSSSRSPVRAVATAVAPGEYRALVESSRGNPVTLTTFLRPASATSLVAFADTCAQAIEIPPTGGRFVGNTSNAAADYQAGCDSGGPGGGAPDQMLRFTISQPQRVLLDMRGSDYNTLLNVRRGPACPGEEILQACAAGYVSDRSFLDLTLDVGEYFVQIDGYSGASGTWQLDVFFSDP